MQTVKRWVKKGVLRPIKAHLVHEDNFFMAREVLSLKEILGRLITAEVAQELGVTETHVYLLVAKGKLSPVRLPQGDFFNPEEIARYKKSRQGVTRWGAKEILGVPTSTLDYLEASGRLTPAPDGSGYDPEAVAKLQRERQKLNPEFEAWLKVEPSARMYTSEQAALQLGIKPNALNRLAREDILPFCTHTLQPRWQIRQFPATYINALAIYTTNAKETNFTAQALAFRDQQKRKYEAERQRKEVEGILPDPSTK